MARKMKKRKMKYEDGGQPKSWFKPKADVIPELPIPPTERTSPLHRDTPGPPSTHPIERTSPLQGLTDAALRKIRRHISTNSSRNPLKTAPDAYKIHAQQLSKEAADSGQKGTLREGKSQFRKDIVKPVETYYRNIISPIKEKIRKSGVVKKAVSNVKSYFGYKHGGKTNYRHGGGLEQYD